MALQDKPEREGEPYLGYYDFKELDLSKATSNPLAVVTDTLGLLVDDRYKQVQESEWKHVRIVLKQYPLFQQTVPNRHAPGTEVPADARLDGVSQELVPAPHLQSLHFQGTIHK